MDTSQKEQDLLHTAQSTMHLAEMKDSITEIERTNNFILKRLNQQQDRMEGEHVHLGELTGTLMERLQNLEQREQKQDAEMQQLVKTVMELGETLSSMCTRIDSIKSALTKGTLGKDRHSKCRGRPGTHHKQEKSQQSDEPKHSLSDPTEGKNSGEARKGTDIVFTNDPGDGSQQTLPSETTTMGPKQVSEISEKSQGSETLLQKNIVKDDPMNGKTLEPLKVSNSGDKKRNEEETSNCNQYSDLSRVSGPDTEQNVEFPNVCDSGPRQAPESPDVFQVSGPGPGLEVKVENSVEGHISNGTISDEMWNSVVEAESDKARESQLPYGDGIDTVFLVDISESMKENGLQQAKDAMNEILDWLELVAKEEQMEENVGVVTFGHITQCRHYLTKDYQSVRECIDGLCAAGSSPLYGGLDMALALFKHKGDATTLVCNHKISPRIVLLSDGQATDHHLLGGQDDRKSPIEPQTREKILTFGRELAERRIPIYCVPIGDDVNQSLLTDLVTTTFGLMVSPDEVFRIGRHNNNLACVLRIKKIIPCDGLDKTALESVVKTTGKTFSADDLEDMIALLGNPAYQETVDEGFSFDDLQENDPNMPPIGTRVRRGPEWKWKNQDGNGVGTVVGHGKDGWIKIEWDCSNKGEYRYGNDQAFDVVVVEEPRLLTQEETIATGCVVCRGIDWEYDDQDGGFGKIGTVYHTKPDGQVWVRWPNGHRGQFKYIATLRQDVEVCDPFEVHQIRAKQQAEHRICVQAEEGATGGVFLASRSSSLSECPSVPDIPHDDDDDDDDDDRLEVPSMSIYDIMQPSKGLSDEEEDEEDKDEKRCIELSLVEAMNRKNESATSLPPRRTEGPEALTEQSPLEDLNSITVKETEGHVTAKETEGKVTVKDTEGHVTSVKEIGHVTVKDTEGHFTVKDTEGHVTSVKETEGHVTTEKEIGHVTVKEAEGHVTVKDTEGHITTVKEVGHVTVKETEGVVTVKDTEGHVTVKDAEGSILHDLDTSVYSSNQQADTPFQLLPDVKGLSGSFQRHSLDDEKVNSCTSVLPSQNYKPVSSENFDGDSATHCERNEITHTVAGYQSDSQSISLEDSVECNESSNFGVPLSQSTPGPEAVGTLRKPEAVASVGTPVTGSSGHSEAVRDDNLDFTKSKFSLTEEQRTYISHPTTDLETSKIKMTLSSESSVLTQSPTDSPCSSLRGRTIAVGADSIRNLSSGTSSLISTSRSQANTSLDVLSETFSDTASLMSTSTMSSTDVIWQWEDKQNVWHAYSPEQNQKIEKTRKRSPKGTVVVSISGENYRVAMYKGIQIHTVTRATNNIRCIDKPNDVANLGDVET
ncbi:uncharacterized protein LOC132551979 [Ylistrum balloti]|uniref:uncharacterized protein LOC132551979 n=1 Tax=Ylistrum balloti TaxID=509963 RepID=UPI002905BA6E|nr:uncharacterized protein LOC132551979 [Ylistrum balloti]